VYRIKQLKETTEAQQKGCRAIFNNNNNNNFYAIVALTSRLTSSTLANETLWRLYIKNSLIVKL
jgi:hypothetical protein